MYTTLIETVQLAAHLSNPQWLCIDCRFDLARPEWGAAAYAQGHIPNAIHADLNQDLSGPVTSSSGRHPLPNVASWAATLGSWGIDQEVQVICYDQNNGAYAARLWWLLRWVGHSRVAVLNGGLAAWQREARPVTREIANRQSRRFEAAGKGGEIVSSTELGRLVAAGALRQGMRTVIDARAADRFAGQNETLDPVAGHIPGAMNHPFAWNLDAGGLFLDKKELRNRWQQTLGTRAPGGVIAMCGSGVTACHNLLALEIAGLHGAKLYAGSWSEWIRDPARPVVVQDQD